MGYLYPFLLNDRPVRVSVNENKLILEIGIFGWYSVGMIMTHYYVFFQTFTRHLAVSFKRVVVGQTQIPDTSWI